MTRLGFPLFAAMFLLPAMPRPAQALGSGPAALCQAATAAAELSTGVPNQLLGAISRVETGRYDPDAGGTRAWPWTINAQGRGHFYESKADAVAAARAFQAAGIPSIDVGCMQINLMYHPSGFSSLDEAFDPHANAAYAARFLTDLFHQTGSWPHAAAAYHSQTPDLGVDYQTKVLEAWAEPTDRPDPVQPFHIRSGPHGTSGSALPPSNVMAAAGSGSPMGARPLGGIGRIIRNTATGAVGSAGGGVGRDLAAYRAMPVAMAFLPPRGLVSR